MKKQSLAKSVAVLVLGLGFVCMLGLPGVALAEDSGGNGDPIDLPPQQVTEVSEYPEGEAMAGEPYAIPPQELIDNPVEPDSIDWELRHFGGMWS